MRSVAGSRTTIPAPLAVEEYSHHAMVLRYHAGASRLPFIPIRSFAGSDLPKVNPDIRLVDNPYGEGTAYVVPPLNPDVTIIHAQRADRRWKRPDLGHHGSPAGGRLRGRARHRDSRGDRR